MQSQRKKLFPLLLWTKFPKKKNPRTRAMTLKKIMPQKAKTMPMRKETRKKSARKITGAESQRLSILVRHSLEMLLLPPVELLVEIGIRNGNAISLNLAVEDHHP